MLTIKKAKELTVMAVKVFKSIGSMYLFMIVRSYIGDDHVSKIINTNPSIFLLP